MTQLPPLVQACAKGDLSRTKRLLDDGEPVNKTKHTQYKN